MTKHWCQWDPCGKPARFSIQLVTCVAYYCAKHYDERLKNCRFLSDQPKLPRLRPYSEYLSRY